jgi:uncharacterized protein (TIGR03435 family)
VAGGTGSRPHAASRLKLSSAVVTPFLFAAFLCCGRGWGDDVLHGQGAQTARFLEAAVSPSGSAASTRVADPTFRAPLSTLRQLAARAFDTTMPRLTGGPDWANTIRWNVQARAPKGTTWSVEDAMLRNLLIERFGLHAQREVRDMDVLVLTWDPKRSHPGLHPPKVRANCAGFLAGREAAPEDAKGMPLCGLSLLETSKPPVFHFRTASLDRIAWNLEGQLGMPIELRSAPRGSFDAELRMPEGFQLAVAGSNRAGVVLAIRDQLGLVGEVQHASVQVVSIVAAVQPGTGQ